MPLALLKSPCIGLSRLTSAMSPHSCDGIFIPDIDIANIYNLDQSYTISSQCAFRLETPFATMLTRMQSQQEHCTLSGNQVPQRKLATDSPLQMLLPLSMASLIGCVWLQADATV